MLLLKRQQVICQSFQTCFVTKVIAIHSFPLLGVCSRLECIRQPEYLIHVFIAAGFITDPDLERTKCHQQETGSLSCRVFLWQGTTQPWEGNEPPAGATWMNHIFTVLYRGSQTQESPYRITPWIWSSRTDETIQDDRRQWLHLSQTKFP